MTDPTPLGAGPALIRASTAVADLYEQSAASVGLSAQQARLLFVVSGHPTNMLGLGAALRLGKSTMTGVIGRLEKAGLIARQPGEHDRREFVVTPTELGAEKVRDFELSLRTRVEGLLATLDSGERTRLAALLSSVLTAVDAAGDDYSEESIPGS